MFFFGSPKAELLNFVEIDFKSRQLSEQAKY